MGEIADATIHGDFCEWCGEFLGIGYGYPRKCKECQEEYDAEDGRKCRIQEGDGRSNKTRVAYHPPWWCKHVARIAIFAIGDHDMDSLEFEEAIIAFAKKMVIETTKLKDKAK